MPEAVPGPLVLGASGQVGWFLLQRLGAGTIAGARRAPTWAPRVPARWWSIDLWRCDEPPPCTQLISAGPLDGCVAWLERTGPGALRRIVALSSLSALHKQHSPLAAERAMAERLRAHEQRLFAFAKMHAIDCTVLRPTLIWGAGLDHSLTPFARRAARRGYAWIPSGASGLRQPVHADDLAALCIGMLARSDAGVFAVGGGEVLSLRQLLARCVEAVGARAWNLPCPRPALMLAGRFGARLGVAAAAAAARAVSDQLAGDDAPWRLAGLAPRGFAPQAANLEAPR